MRNITSNHTQPVSLYTLTALSLMSIVCVYCFTFVLSQEGKSQRVREIHYLERHDHQHGAGEKTAIATTIIHSRLADSWWPNSRTGRISSVLRLDI